MKTTTFPASKITSGIVDQLLGLISSCLDVVPGHRPKASELLAHAFFAGQVEKVGAMPYIEKMFTSSEGLVMSSNVVESENSKDSSSLRIPSDENQSSPEDGVASPTQISADSSVEMFQQASLKDDSKFEEAGNERVSQDAAANNCLVERKSSSSESMVSKNSDERQSSSDDGLVAPANISIGSSIEIFEPLSIKDDHKCEVIEIDEDSHDDNDGNTFTQFFILHVVKLNENFIKF